MPHPDYWLILHEYEHRDQLREVETWRLVRATRRTRYVAQLLHRVISAARQRLSLRARPKSAKFDLANMEEAFLLNVVLMWLTPKWNQIMWRCAIIILKP